MSVHLSSNNTHIKLKYLIKKINKLHKFNTLNSSVILFKSNTGYNKIYSCILNCFLLQDIESRNRLLSKLSKLDCKKYLSLLYVLLCRSRKSKVTVGSSRIKHIQYDMKLKSFHPWNLSLFEYYVHKMTKFPWKNIMNLISISGSPTTKKVFTVLRSPHIDKKSRDQYTLKTYSRLFKYVFKGQFSWLWSIYWINEMAHRIPAGVGLSIKNKINCIYN